ncbi:hypothetical protein [Burkholderia sp. Ac-20353]|nr:hypothetical protein [Burkholderia sp. Ac-20353]
MTVIGTRKRCRLCGLWILNVAMLAAAGELPDLSNPVGAFA